MNKTIKNIKDILSIIIKKAPLIYFADFLLVLLSMCFPVIVVKVWQKILSIISNQNLDYAAWWFVVLIVVGGLSKACFFFTELVDAAYRDILSRKMQESLHEKSRKIPLDYFENPKINSLINRATSVFCYGSGVGVSLSVIYVLSTNISMLISIAMVFNYDVYLGLIFLPYILIQFVKIKNAESLADLNEYSQEKKRVETIYESYLAKYDYYKDKFLLNTFDMFADKWNAVNDEKTRYENEFLKVYARKQMIIDVLSDLLYVITIGLAAYLLTVKRINIAEIGAIILLLETVKSQVRNVVDCASDFTEGVEDSMSGLKYFQLAEHKVDNTHEADKNASEVLISLKDVIYKYPSSDSDVIKNVNMNIEKGKSYAVVGKNGSGKTTLYKLILGMIEAKSGQVKYKGQNIQNYSYDNIYKDISLVSQNYDKYALSIEDNVYLSKTSEEKNVDEIKSLVDEFALSELVDSLDDGMQSKLDKEYGGIELSGGQLQTVALMRGFYRNKDFIILDEPTASLDSIHEAVLYRKILDNIKGKTSVIISHRMAITPHVDHIFVVDDGKIVEEGSHKELMKTDSMYKEFFQLQAVQYE